MRGAAVTLLVTLTLTATAHPAPDAGGRTTGAESLRGTVRTVASEGRQLLVTLTDGRGVRLMLTSGTRVRRGRRAISAGDLHTGELVMVVYLMENENRIAQSILAEDRPGE